MPDVGKSAVRKATRSGRIVSSLTILKTTFRTRILPRFSVILGTFVWNTGEKVLARVMKKPSNKSSECLAVQTTLYQRVKSFLLAQCGMIVFGAVGAGLGTLLFPGKGTVSGVAFGETAFLLLGPM